MVVNENMTGKEIVNLINKLQEKGMSSDEIIELIKYIELTDPKYTASDNKELVNV